MSQQTVDFPSAAESSSADVPRLPRPVLAHHADFSADPSAANPLFCFGGANAEGDVFNEVVAGLEAGSAVYVCCFPGDGEAADGNWANRTFVSVAEEYARYIREIQPHGPYFLCGYSLGARVAFDVARQLREAGEPVGMIALLDAWAPGFPTHYSRGQRIMMHIRTLLRGRGALQYLKFRVGRLAHRLVQVAAKKVQAATGRNTSAWGELIPGRPTKLGTLPPPGYRPFVYEGDILFLRADLTPDWPGCNFSDPQCGWTPFVRGAIEVRRINCRHLDVLRDPAAREVARLLDTQMRASRSASITATKADRVAADQTGRICNE